MSRDDLSAGGVAPDAAEDVPAKPVTQQAERYPEYRRTFLPLRPPLSERFADLREELLVGHCYNTARAYWSDLDDINDWAEGHGKDVLALTDRDIRQYRALLRRRKYSENTVRRRMTALNALYAKAASQAAESH